MNEDSNKKVAEIRKALNQGQPVYISPDGKLVTKTQVETVKAATPNTNLTELKTSRWF